MRRTAMAKVAPDITRFRARLKKGDPSAHLYVTLLGLKTYDALRLLREVEGGLSFSSLERFHRNTAFSMQQLIDLVQIRPRTLIRRKEEGKLHPDESDRLLRASRTFGRALALFEGDAEAARMWLETPQPALAGATPLSIAKTDVGAREVETLIGRLEHGIPS